jgi:FeS assembly protein IscX
MPEFTFSWTDVEDIAEALREQYPDRDPITIRFPELTGMVEKLEGFKPLPGQSVNEKILEAIQAAWIEEHEEDD